MTTSVTTIQIYADSKKFFGHIVSNKSFFRDFWGPKQYGTHESNDTNEFGGALIISKLQAKARANKQRGER